MTDSRGAAMPPREDIVRALIASARSRSDLTVTITMDKGKLATLDMLGLLFTHVDGLLRSIECEIGRYKKRRIKWVLVSFDSVIVDDAQRVSFKVEGIAAKAAARRAPRRAEAVQTEEPA